MRIFLLLLRFLLVAVLLLVVWWALGPKWDFVITFDNGRVDIRGRIPDAIRWRLVQFLQEDVLLRGRIKIYGRRGRDGYLALKFDGRVFQEDRQRIRNYLTSIF